MENSDLLDFSGNAIESIVCKMLAILLPPKFANAHRIKITIFVTDPYASFPTRAQIKKGA